MRAPASVTLLFLLGLVPAGEARADLGKLDARARVAVERLRATEREHRLPESALSAVSNTGRLDVFIEGRVDRAQLEAAGAHVRTALPGIFTADVPASAVEALSALPGVTAIRGAAPVELELDMSVPAIGASTLRGAGPTFTGLNGQGILIGAVDSGVDFDHGDFKDASGHSRLIRIWDQSSVGAPPPNFLYGTEWSNTAIDLGACTEIDEIGHGTHVLGVAGGDGSQTGGSAPAYTYAGVAPRADLAMVKTNFTNTGIVDGVHYLFDLAASRHQNAVVNLSVGTQFGSHDGLDAFESAIAALAGPGRIIVKSAGNDRGSARHAEVKVASTGSPVTMSVSGSAAGRAVQIDGYYNKTENMSLKITTPSGTVIGPLARGVRSGPFPGTSTSNGSVYVENGVSRGYLGDYEVYIEINASTGQVMNGTWTFTFVPNTPGLTREVDLWRFFSSAGLTANFVTGNQPNEELISEPGNADAIITAAGWVTKQSWTNCAGTAASFNPAAVGTIAWFSSPGPTRDGRPKPDITAPASAVVSTTSFDAAPTCATNPDLMGDGLNHVVDYGTSVASAHVAGVAALLMQTRGALTPTQVRNYLIGNAVHDANTGTGWNANWGNGKLHISPNTAFAPDPTAPPIELAIQSIQPNPTRRSARIAYVLPRASDVRVGIVDVQGRAVATLVQGFQAAGPHEASWSGDEGSGIAPAGLYFVIVQTPGARTLGRLVVTR